VSILSAIAQASRLAQAQGTGSLNRGSFVAPVGGLNSRDNIANMDPSYAIELVNFFPDRGRVTLRGNAIPRVDLGTSVAVETLIPVHGAAAGAEADHLFAASGGEIWEVYPAKQQVVTGKSYNRWQQASVGATIVLCNGTDTPLQYSNGSFADWAVTGPTDITALIQPLLFKNRIWVVEKDSPVLWYGDTNAVQGTLTSFDLSHVHPSGGNVSAIGTLTLDSGHGVDDLFIIAYDSGALMAYSGTDPATAASWSLVGVFNAPPVIGRRPFLKLGGDLVAITENGYVSISQFLRGASDAPYLTISDLILGAVREDTSKFAHNNGWEAILHGSANWLLFNVPDAGGARQHVQNVQTGAWCEFRGMNAQCWTHFDNDRLFYGGADGIVYEADVRDVPTGEAETIYGTVKTAFSYLGTPFEKQFRALRPHVSTNGPTQFKFSLGLDFFDTIDFAPPRSIRPTATKFDETRWDSAKWGGSTIRQTWWQDMRAAGSSANISLEVTAQGLEVTWYGAEVAFEVTRGLY